MKIKLLTPLFIFFLYQTTASAQTQAKTGQNNLEISTGYNFGALKNLEIAPLSRYDYDSPIYKLNYERLTRKEKIIAVRLNYLSSELKSDVAPALNLDYAKVGLEISVLKKVYAKNNFSIHLGLSSLSNVSIYAKDNNDRSLLHQTFGIAGRFAYQINKRQRITTNVAVPLLLLRSTHASSGIYSLDRYQSIVWKLRYSYSLSNDFDVNLNYNFNYDRLQVLSAYREVQHQINLGINYKF